MNKATAARGEANRAIEAARGEKLVGASLEAKVVLHAADEAFAAQLRSRVEELKPFFIVSELEVADSAEEVTSVCGATSELKGAEAEAAGLGADGIIAGVTKAGGEVREVLGFLHGVGLGREAPGTVRAMHENRRRGGSGVHAARQGDGGGGGDGVKTPDGGGAGDETREEASSVGEYHRRRERGADETRGRGPANAPPK